MTFDDLMAMVDESTMIRIKTQDWQMENPLSAGTIRELMYNRVQNLVVREITPKNAALMIWAEEK